MPVEIGKATYEGRALAEAEFWDNPPGLNVGVLESLHPESSQRCLNAAYTGDPGRTWLEDLIARGPYRRAAMLGSSEGVYESVWLRMRASRSLDVYDLSKGAIGRTRRRLAKRWLGIPWPEHRVRLIAADLNFVRLPRGRYDVVWSAGCIHHVVNLEHLFDEVHEALVPGGILAFQDYVGEPRLQYSEERLQLVNQILEMVPPCFRRGEGRSIERPKEHEMSPFEAVRSDEILGAAASRFDLLHIGQCGYLHPLGMFIDMHAIDRQEPELLERILEIERDAGRDHPAVSPASVYAVFRRRAADTAARSA